MKQDLEGALSRIKDIQAARVMFDDEGGVREIHVLSDTFRSAKQIVRDVESVLLAGFGLAVDHKKVSVAQLDPDIKPSERKVRTDRLKAVNINVDVKGPTASALVKLKLGEEENEGSANGAATIAQQRRIIAIATLQAAEKFLKDESSFALEEVAVVTLEQDKAALCSVNLSSSLRDGRFIGSAFIRRSEPDAVVRAALDALNRQFSILTA
ncbi:MAG: hypothetical protein QMD53_04910 [Actinomycetota bacterium]|nr:hypothetical protein [Actinomycetota bacterium]